MDDRELKKGSAELLVLSLLEDVLALGATVMALLWPVLAALLLLLTLVALWLGFRLALGGYRRLRPPVNA